MNIPSGKVLMVKLMEWERKTGNKFMTLILNPTDVSLTDMVTLAEIVVGFKPESPKDALEVYMKIIGEISGAETEAMGALEPEEQQALELLQKPSGVPVNSIGGNNVPPGATPINNG